MLLVSPIDVLEVLLLCQFHSVLLGFQNVIAVKLNLCTVSLTLRNLHKYIMHIEVGS